jgi:hypothetical protein
MILHHLPSRPFLLLFVSPSSCQPQGPGPFASRLLGYRIVLEYPGQLRLGLIVSSAQLSLISDLYSVPCTNQKDPENWTDLSRSQIGQGQG